MIHSVPNKGLSDDVVSGEGFIGIGPKSDLVRKFGNVAVLEDEVILGDSYPANYFSAGCEAGSELFIPIEEYPNGMIGSMGTVGVMDQRVLITLRSDTDVPFVVPYLNLLTFRVSKKYPEFDAESFRCNDEILRLLTPLDFDFGASTIRIEPIHYVERLGDMCRLKVKEVRNTAALNPLVIPDKNVKFTSHGLEICDRIQIRVY